ncbi:MAG: acylphosphatase [Candidatus Micrarchaeia archaeon]
MISAKMLLYGRVQGVGCRAFVSSIARRLGVTGTVRNMENGSVEIICECGSENIFEEFKNIISKGNGLVEAERIEIVERKTAKNSEFKSFYIAY